MVIAWSTIWPLRFTLSSIRVRLLCKTEIFNKSLNHATVVFWCSYTAMLFVVCTLSLLWPVQIQNESTQVEMCFCGWMNIALTPFFFLLLTHFWLVTENGGWIFIDVLQRLELSPFQFRLKYFMFPRCLESKSHSVYWTDHQCSPLWHVMTQTASFLLFVSMAGRYRWCCQEAPYTIRHSVMQSLHVFFPQRAILCSPVLQFSAPCFLFHLCSEGKSHWFWVFHALPVYRSWSS